MYNKIKVKSAGKMAGGNLLSEGQLVEVTKSEIIKKPSLSAGKYRNTLKMGYPVDIEAPDGSVATQIKFNFNSAAQLEPGSYTVKVYEATINGETTVYLAL